MKGALVTYYDDRYAALASISRPGAQAFAKRLGFDFVVYNHPYVPRLRANFLNLTLRTYDWLIYADVDVVFSATAELWPGADANPISMSYDANGACDGVMSLIRQPDVVRLLTCWGELGPADNCGHEYNQSTLKLLMRNFSWVRALMSPISRALVSCPDCLTAGSTAHHFWNVRGKHIAEDMQAYADTGVVPASSLADPANPPNMREGSPFW